MLVCRGMENNVWFVQLKHGSHLLLVANIGNDRVTFNLRETLVQFTGYPKHSCLILIKKYNRRRRETRYLTRKLRANRPCGSCHQYLFAGNKLFNGFLV